MSRNKQRNKWAAWIHVDGKKRQVGMFIAEEEAAAACRGAEVEVAAGRPIPARTIRQAAYVSLHKGGSWDKRANKWAAKIRVDGKKRHVGMFIAEEEAAAACMGAEVEVAASRPLPAGDRRVQKRVQTGASSQHRGVSWIKSTGKWKAQIQINGKRRNLGSFANEEDAAQAYRDEVPLD